MLGFMLHLLDLCGLTSTYYTEFAFMLHLLNLCGIMYTFYAEFSFNFYLELCGVNLLQISIQKNLIK